MPCFTPLKGFKSASLTKSGKHTLVFDSSRALANGLIKGTELTVPCGQCIGCRLERGRQWAMRCMHEAQMHKDNCFITLTYRPADLPKNANLEMRDFQLFLKRLRVHFARQKFDDDSFIISDGNGIRYFGCGEYGDNFDRPHFHSILFNCDFSDKKYFKKLPSGCSIYTSDLLDKLWGKGYCSIGTVTFASAAYVARYVLKKRNGKDSDDHYAIITKEGKRFVRSKESSVMSRRPGIAKYYYDRFKSEIYFSDSIVMEGREMLPPRFYDILLERENPELMFYIKHKRKISANLRKEDNTDDRLLVKERVSMLNVVKLLRNLDKDDVI